MVTKIMQVKRALVKSCGRRISEMTGMKADVPAEETKMVTLDVTPVAKVAAMGGIA